MVSFEELLSRISLPREAAADCLRLHGRCSEEGFSAGIREALRAYETGDQNFGNCLAHLAGRLGEAAQGLNLYLYLILSRRTLAAYREKAIDEKVFYDTLSDYRILCHVCRKTTGIYGISQDYYRRWARLHLDQKLYRLGRLQFELAESDRDLEAGGISLSRGQPCISVHIPAGAPLGEEAWEASYALARAFFRQYYAMEQCVFVCNSWLMHPWLSECLPSHYSIVRFQQKYALAADWEDFATFSYWVFPDHCGIPDLSRYPRDTALRRLALQRAEAGLPVGKGIGLRL